MNFVKRHFMRQRSVVGRSNSQTTLRLFALILAFLQACGPVAPQTSASLRDVGAGGRDVSDYVDFETRSGRYADASERRGAQTDETAQNGGTSFRGGSVMCLTGNCQDAVNDYLRSPTGDLVTRKLVEGDDEAPFGIITVTAADANGGVGVAQVYRETAAEWFREAGLAPETIAAGASGDIELSAVFRCPQNGTTWRQVGEYSIRRPNGTTETRPQPGHLPSLKPANEQRGNRNGQWPAPSDGANTGSPDAGTIEVIGHWKTGQARPTHRNPHPASDRNESIFPEPGNTEPSTTDEPDVPVGLPGDGTSAEPTSPSEIVARERDAFNRHSVGMANDMAELGSRLGNGSEVIRVSGEQAAAAHSAATQGIRDALPNPTVQDPGSADPANTDRQRLPPSGPALERESQLRTAPDSPAGRRVRDAFGRHDDVRAAIDAQNAQDREKRLAMVDTAGLSLLVADEELAAGNETDGEHNLDTALAILDLVVGVIPGVSFVHDVVSVATGVNMITGQALSTTDRVVIAGTLFAPAAISGTTRAVRSMARKVGKHTGKNPIAKQLTEAVKKSDEKIKRVTDSTRPRGIDAPQRPTGVVDGEATDEFLARHRGRNSAESLASWAKAPDKNYGTGRDKAVFNSGEGNFSAAEDWARANDKEMIGDTDAGFAIDTELFTPELLTEAEKDALGAAMSQRYAERASGDVNAFARNALPERIFWGVEAPVLIERMDPTVPDGITSITFRDPGGDIVTRVGPETIDTLRRQSPGASARDLAAQLKEVVDESYAATQ